MATEHSSGHASNNHPGGHPAMDYAEHNRTYSGFIKGTIGLIVACVLILVGMAAFLV
jgi:Bacterial aa3 type cytochrome c oxidase subunit IV